MSDPSEQVNFMRTEVKHVAIRKSSHVIEPNAVEIECACDVEFAVFRPQKASNGSYVRDVSDKY